MDEFCFLNSAKFYTMNMSYGENFPSDHKGY